MADVLEEVLEDAAQDRYRVTAGELRQFVERYERLTLAPQYVPPVMTGGRLVLHIEDNLSNL